MSTKKLPVVGKPSIGRKVWNNIKTIVTTLLLVIVVNVFLVEGFIIPSSSMEDTLLIGDFILVNKLAYGARIPITPIASPFHNTIYSTLLQLPYWRLPSTQTINRNDVIVFNLPTSYTLPIDKRALYIKRCVGLPGDTIEIINKNIFITNTFYQDPATIQHNYFLRPDSYLDINYLKKLNIHEGGRYYTGEFDYTFHVSKADRDSLKKRFGIDTMEVIVNQEKENQQQIYPNNPSIHRYNADFWGPIVVPKKNQTIALNAFNIDLYKEMIQYHEGKKIELVAGSIYINEQVVREYTFEQNYYFMMGDNRDNSEDSRYWGLVPESHLIGKASYILFSRETEFRSDRWCKSIE